MNDEIFNVLYNKENYLQQISVVKEKSSGNLSSPYEFQVTLLNTLIKKIQLVHDIKLPLIIGELIFDDKNFELYSKLKSDNNKIFINLLIKKIDKTVAPETVTLDNQFYMTNIEFMEQKLDSVLIKFEFIGIDWIKFCNNFKYSSGTNPKSYIQILTEIFRQNNLNLDSKINTVNKSGIFITPTYYTLLDSITYVLKRAIDINYGFYFITYDPIKKIYSLIDSNQIYTKSATLPDNQLNLPTKQLIMMQQRTINKIKKQNYLNKEKNMEIVKNVTLKDYDYSKRAFKNDLYTFNGKIKEIMPNINDKRFELNLNRIDNNIDSGINNYNKEQLYRRFDFYTHLSDLFLYSNVIEFYTYGVIQRYAGQTLDILVSEDSPFSKDYDGSWFMQRIYHTFVNGSYSNMIQANRLDQRIQ